MATKYIAHCSIDERKKASGGQSGDQTGKECCIRTWYDKPFTQVFRIMNEEVRIQFANNMIDCANNDKIGYDQNERNTLLKEALKVKFDFSKISTKCEADCSSMVTACLLGAIYIVLGVEVYEKAKAVMVVGGNCATTSTLKTRLTKLTMIEVKVFDSSEYTRGTSKAVYGDIYNKPSSHVVAYIDDGNKKTFKKEVEKTRGYDKTLEADYKTTSSLNLRIDAGKTETSVVVIPTNTKVKCFGYYATVDGTKWLFIKVTVSGKDYIGFSSSNYLKKI